MITIVDYGMGNLGSVANMLRRIGADCEVTGDPVRLADASRILLPGVGAFDAAMERIHAAGIRPVLEDKALRQKVPVLGICLGMQLLFDASAEGDTQGLGLISGRIEAMTPEAGRPVPHMGWNTLQGRWDDPLLHGLAERDWFYFVHGFFAKADERYTLASTDYGISIAAVVRHGHFRGVQFHPERSGASGARLLKNFLSVRP